MAWGPYHGRPVPLIPLVPPRYFEERMWPLPLYRITPSYKAIQSNSLSPSLMCGSQVWNCIWRQSSPPYAHRHVIGTSVRINLLLLLCWTRVRETSSTPDVCRTLDAPHMRCLALNAWSLASGARRLDLVCLRDLEVGVYIRLHHPCSSANVNHFRSSRV